MEASSNVFDNLSDVLNNLSIQNCDSVSFELPNFKMFPDVFEQVFGYLDIESLCNASLVCSAWGEFIANSPSLMEKVQLKIDMLNEHEAIRAFDVLSNSTRNFKSIKIKLFMAPCEKIVAFMEKHQWAEINLDCQCIEFPNISPKCLEKTASITVNALEIYFVKNLLLSTSNLIHLKLNLSVMKECDWSMLQNLKLETLVISLAFGVSFRARNVNLFLKSQMSLKSLEVQGIAVDNETMTTVVSMPSLKRLRLNKLFIEMDLTCFDMNKEMKALEKLIVHDDSFAMGKLCYELLWSTPNLTYLDIPKLDQSLITHAGYRLRYLEELRTGELVGFSALSCPDLFPMLCQIKIRKRLTSTLKNEIKRQVHMELTNFKICLYEESSKKPHTLSNLDR